MTVTLGLFDVCLLVLGACALACGFMYMILRLGAWIEGRPW